MDKTALNHLTTASELDGITGVYNYTPEATPAILAENFTARMYKLYHVDLSQRATKSIIDAVGTEETTSEGNFSTRFIKEWKRRNNLPNYENDFYEYKPVTEAKSVIGDLFKQIYSAKPRRLYYRITNDIQNILEDDNRDSGYGNPHSCWFASGCYGRSPRILEDASGAGILIGTADPVNVANGIGRAWLVNGNNGLVIFNPYLDLDGVNRETEKIFRIFGEILAQALGYKLNGNLYEKENQPTVYFSLRYFDNHTEGIYINDDRGLILTDKTQPRIGNPFYNYDDFYTCDNCGCVIDEDDAYYSPDGEPLCYDCYSENCTTCERCGDTIWRDDAYYDEYATYCEYCYNETHTICDKCEETINTHYEDFYETEDGLILCDNCYTEYLKEKEERERTEQESQAEPVLYEKTNTEPELTDQERIDQAIEQTVKLANEIGLSQSEIDELIETIKQRG